MHSHHYVDPQSHYLHGKRILVVGIGNSSADITVELRREGDGWIVLVVRPTA